MTQARLTPSDVLEYLYCPRFLYYERVLGIPEHQELRQKVQMGRELHDRKERENASYLRKKVNVQEKRIDVELHSDRLGLSGRVDEVLLLADGEAAPLDYKFAEWSGVVYENHRIQSMLYGLLIEEAFSRDVSRGYLVFVRSQHHVEELSFTAVDRERAVTVLEEMHAILQRGYYPAATRWKARCPDCCYRNICPR